MQTTRKIKYWVWNEDIREYIYSPTPPKLSRFEASIWDNTNCKHYTYTKMKLMQKNKKR
jgi:hypothetical protein